MAAGDIAGITLSWHQFDRIDRLVNEANPGTFDLFTPTGGVAPTWAADATGVEYQAPFVNGVADVLAIVGSNTISNGFKPTSSDGSSVNYYLHATFGSGNAAGTLPIAGRYAGGVNEFRLMLVSGELQFVMVDGNTNPIIDSNVSPANGDRVHVFFGYTNESSAGANDGVSTLHVYDDGGTLIGSASSEVVGNLAAAGTAGREIHLGGQGPGSNTSPNFAAHAFAAFNRVLTEEERLWIINGGVGRRWWTVKQAQLEAGGEVFGGPAGSSFYGNTGAVSGLFSSHRQVMYLSDSYGWLVSNGGRPIAALTQAIAPATWAAIQLPYDNPSMFGTFNTSGSLGVTPTAINASSSYAVDGGSGAYTLHPYHGVRFAIGTGFAGANAPIASVTVDRASTADGEAGTFEDPAVESYGAIVTYRLPTASAYPSIRVNGTTVSLTGTAGQANQTGVIFVDNYQSGSPVSFTIDGPTKPGSTQQLEILGVTLVKLDGNLNPIKGFYLTGIADDSWSYSGHGADLASIGNKQYSAAQARYYIDATSIDDAQDITVLCYMDIEPVNQANHKLRIESVLESWRAAHAASNRTGRINFLIIVPPCVATGNSGFDSIDAVKYGCYEMRKACEEIAASDSGFAWISIPEYTEYNHWTSIDVNHGNFDLGDDSGSDWLAANGFSTISYGTNEDVNLATTNGTAPRDLMTDGAHPDSEVGNVFFWSIVSAGLQGAGSPSNPVRFLSKTGRATASNQPDSYELALKVTNKRS